jgi:hypothetical protein
MLEPSLAHDGFRLTLKKKTKIKQEIKQKGKSFQIPEYNSRYFGGSQVCALATFILTPFSILTIPNGIPVGVSKAGKSLSAISKAFSLNM